MKTTKPSACPHSSAEKLHHTKPGSLIPHAGPLHQTPGDLAALAPAARGRIILRSHDETFLKSPPSSTKDTSRHFRRSFPTHGHDQSPQTEVLSC
jgi:hypothetical protein